ncbi:MAG: hypothetical protein P0121_04675 [Nitrospira sp.]|nr:hypothetical protein [Nitrospira sp.]
MITQRFFWLPLLVLSLCPALNADGRERPPFVDQGTTAIAQKKLAIQLFVKDQKVKAEINALQNSQYKILTTDAIPYRFAYGDEGPHANFLVTAWLGKPAAYGWSAAFVTAIVTTDPFGPPSVKLLNSSDLQKLLPE